MSRRCYLHVGMHKTGSSSIQDALSGYDDGRLEYLKLDRPNHSVPLVSAVMPNLQDYPQVKKRKLTSVQVDDLKKQSSENLYTALQVSRDKDVIISAEYFSQPGISAKENFSRLHSILKEFFDDIQIIAYIRSPKSFMESVLQERIKGGDTKVSLNSLYPHYRGRFEKFYELVGAKNITLVDYDPSSFPDGSVVLDFCKRVGASFSASKHVSSNEKIGYEAMALLYSYNLFRSFVSSQRYSTRFSQAFMTGLQSISASKFSLDLDVVNDILSNHKDDICWIEERKGIPFKSCQEVRGYIIASLNELVQYIKRESDFYVRSKQLPDFSDNIPRSDLFEAFLTSHEHSCFSLDRNGFDSFQNSSEKPVVAFRELSKALFKSGLVSQSKLVLDLALSRYPGAKGLQELNEQVCTALDDLGVN